MDGLGGFFTAFRAAMDVGKKKRPDEEQEGGPYIGGDPSQGRYAMASDPDAPDEPPMGRGGTSYYLDGEDPRDGGGQPEQEPPPGFFGGKDGRSWVTDSGGSWGRGGGFGK